MLVLKGKINEVLENFKKLIAKYGENATVETIVEGEENDVDMQ